MSAIGNVKRQRRSVSLGRHRRVSRFCSAYWKDTFKEIIKSFGRYLSLIIITALGSSSVVGILATSIDMRAAADKMYKQSNLYDIQIKSTTGFSGDDISALRDVSGVGVVMPTSIFDVYTYFENETRTIRTFALPGELNGIRVVEGRLPESTGECAVERAVLRYGGFVLGDVITLGLDDMDDYYDVLEHDEFTIVGVVVSPFFITSHDKGSTSLGDGRLDHYMYLHPDTYVPDVFTDAYVLMNGSQDMDNLTSAYNDAADEWVNLVERAGDMRVQVKSDEFLDAQEEIDDGWQEYSDGVAELEEKVADGRKELDDAEIELRDALAELEDAQKALDDAEEKLEDARKELEDAQATLDKEIAKARAEIRKNERELERGSAEVYANRAALEAGQDELDQARKPLLAGLNDLESIAPYGVSPDLDARYDMIYAALAQIAGRQAEINAGRSGLDAADRAIRDGAAKIRSARATVERKRSSAQSEIDEGWADVEEGRVELEDGRIELEDGWIEYYDGLDEWRDGLETLEREEADALIELADAKLELEDAQETLDAAPVPEWFYFTRKDNHAFDSYFSDTLRLESIGYVFPLVFFVVALLVSLTTMSRMVDEQRTQIGIYKALGYGSLRIAMKLLIYAFSASVTGGVLGAVFGSNFFPRVIFSAYLHLYDMQQIETPVPVNIGLVAASTSAGLVLIVTLVTSLRSMRSSPAEMMRPKAPPSGKRVLIERVAFLWRRLSFTSKVTARNIFRYKKRFIMSLAGVAGCTALLLTSFGLRDSLAAVSGLQYGRLMEYTSRAYIKEITSTHQRAGLDALMSGEWLYFREESVSANNSAFSISMIVPESTDELGRYINFYSGSSGQSIAMSAGGILITEKLARETGVSVGDDFSFTLSGGGAYQARVTGVVENYIFHYIYLPPELYAELFGAEPLYNSIYIISDEASAGALLDNSDVRAVIHTSSIMRSTSDSTDALEIVAIVLVFLACALAFVVLFNLTNINITERIRELATIKVLGFYSEELSMYIYRENIIVTLMGIAIGLVAGVFLHGYVLKAAEVDLLMFPRIISHWSYVYSVGLAAVFAIFVNLVMNIKLSRIDMVESLKNVE